MRSRKLEYKYEVEKKVERTQYAQKVKNLLGQKLKEEKIEFSIENRLKPLYSIYKKMQKIQKPIYINKIVSFSCPGIIMYQIILSALLTLPTLTGLKPLL